MTGDAIIYVDVRAVLDHPVDRLWVPIAAFGGLDRWAAGVTGCTVEGQGPGAIRTVSLSDRQARERLEAIDPRHHRLRYEILPPHAMPARNVHSEIALTARDDGRTALRWHSEATDFAVPPEQLGAAIGAFYRRSLEGLDRMLRDG
jgi:hypothetical protein